MAKSSGDLITWNNCRCSSSLPLAAINLYDFPSRTLSCWLLRLCKSFTKIPRRQMMI
jgi:hypothetical protein